MLAIEERTQVSISLFGFCRVRTHSMKLVQCSGCGSVTRFISKGSRSDPFSGVTRHTARSTYSVPRGPWNVMPIRRLACSSVLFDRCSHEPRKLW